MALFARGGDSSSAERNERIREKKKEGLIRLYDMEARRAKNLPSLLTIDIYLPEKDVIAAVHEELCLRQMQRYLGDSSSLFYKNKRRFDSAEKLNPGYRYTHKWFLINNPQFAEKYRGISYSKLKEIRKRNKNDCNYLCSERRKYLKD